MATSHRSAWWPYVLLPPHEPRPVLLHFELNVSGLDVVNNGRIILFVFRVYLTDGGNDRKFVSRERTALRCVDRIVHWRAVERADEECDVCAGHGDLGQGVVGVLEVVVNIFRDSNALTLLEIKLRQVPGVFLFLPSLGRFRLLVRICESLASDECEHLAERPATVRDAADSVKRIKQTLIT